MALKGEFHIQDWQEKTLKTLAPKSKINSATVKVRYTGDITGEGEVQYHLNYQHDDNADFIGFEVIQGVINEQSVTLILKHDGSFKVGIASSKFIVVNSFPEQSYIGLKGEFNAKEGGLASYQLG